MTKNAPCALVLLGTPPLYATPRAAPPHHASRCDTTRRAAPRHNTAQRSSPLRGVFSPA